MFRLQNNVPPVYVEQSRDFQLLCRLMDCSQGAVKYDIDSIVRILDASKIRDSLLQLLCTKVGFFPTRHIDADTLKYIVAAFPYLIKYKGTVQGVRLAVQAVMKAEFTEAAKEAPTINISQREPGAYGAYTITIITSLSDYNRQALEEVLYYIKPIGYKYVIVSIAGSVAGSSALTTTIGFKDRLYTYKTNTSKTAEIANAAPTERPNDVPAGSEINPQYLGYGQVIAQPPEVPKESKKE